MYNWRGNYNNEWIVEGKVLKYYLEGRKDAEGEKAFNENIISNQAVINATNNYPILLFVRNRKGELFVYDGYYHFSELVTESDGAKYFILIKNGEEFRVSQIMPQLEDESFPEGKEKSRIHIFKERNPRVIEKAKRNFKQANGRIYCEVCGFDFEKAYGEQGKDYIEGHHTKPISELNEGDKTNIEDILLVCSNCHRMLHRKRSWITKEKLQGFINKDYIGWGDR